MGQVEAKCPHCGYEFSPARKPRTGFAWSGLGDAVLMFGQITAGLCILLSLLLCVSALIHGNVKSAIFYGPVATALLLANCVVLARVSSMDGGER